MANANRPDGFKPYNNPFGGAGNPVVMEFPLHASNSEIGVGSPVRLVDDGVNLAAAAGTLGLLGIAAEYKAANAGGSIKVWADPNQLFVSQTDDGTGTMTAATCIGNNATFVGTGVTNRRSTSELDETSGTTTSTLQFKVVDLSDEYVGNARNAYGEFNRLVVKINNHQLGGGVGHDGI